MNVDYYRSEDKHIDIEKMVEDIKKLKEEVEKLREEKVNREPYRWLQHRVGQLQRRLDKYNLI